MAMLAEQRRKQKWTLNPRGKQWSEDSNKFGQKMLEKMGWTSGKGLGANLDGMTEHIRARYKNDQGGIGFSNEDRDKQWTQHQEGYNELLQKLQNGESADSTINEKELSGKSLELKSKQSRARVHYRKFTRGKDVNKYSTKDLANIFGKRELDEKPEVATVAVKTEIEDAPLDPIGASDTSHGIVTTKGGSITDYFKNKMSSIVRKSNNDEFNGEKNDPASEDERYVGFGFSETKTKEKFSFENPALDIASPEMTVTPRKNGYVFENAALEIGDSPPEVKFTPKQIKSEFSYDNAALDFENFENAASTPIRKIKKEKKIKSSPNSADFEVISKIEKSSEIEENADTTSKKKRKIKSKDRCNAFVDGFTNEALNLELRDSENKEKLKFDKFEVSRSDFGLANDALDLSDESNGKKRVTFNEKVEYDTTMLGAKRKKSKNIGKLDKFEVENDKAKRKKKKSKKTEIANNEGVFVNAAMDVEVFSEEANDNVVNERKMEKARRKRERRISNLETIVEAPEEEKESSLVTPEVITLNDSIVGETSENLEVLCLGTPKRRKKRKSSKNNEEIVAGNENFSRSMDEKSEDIEVIVEIARTKVKVEKKVKTEANSDENSMEIREVEEINGKRNNKRKFESVDEEIQEMEIIDSPEIPKSSKRKKTKRRNDESKENVDENSEVMTENNENGGKKKRKKLKKPKIEVKEELDDSSTNEIRIKNEVEANDVKNVDQWNEEIAKSHVEMQNGSRSPWDSKARRSKKIFKSLFAQSPILHFSGSNINEIKGYGMDHE